VKPCSSITSASPTPLTDHYLRDALRAHLERSEACFDFMVQFQTDNRTMPIEDATVEWKEQQSPFRAVARIRIPSQNIEEQARISREGGEALVQFKVNSLVDEEMIDALYRASYDGVQVPHRWVQLHQLHQPLGGMNRARRDIYRSMAEFRHERQAD
jgi:hypothetical protein